MDKNKSSFNGLTSEGFSLLEVLVSLVIFSIGLMGIVSVSIATVKNNSLSKGNLAASVLAQNKMESLRNQAAQLTGSLGGDGILGDGTANCSDGADDTFPTDFQATGAAGAAAGVTAPATMFANPDHAEDSNGTDVAVPPTLGTAPMVAWVVRNNVPGPGMKYITVVVGWKVGGLNLYTTVSNSMLMN